MTIEQAPGGRRITFGMSWAKLLGKAGAGGPRKEAAPEEVVQPGSGGVKDNVRDELAESQERR